MTIRGILKYQPGRYTSAQITELQMWVKKKFGDDVAVINGAEEGISFMPMEDSPTVRQMYKMSAGHPHDDWMPNTWRDPEPRWPKLEWAQKNAPPFIAPIPFHKWAILAFNIDYPLWSMRYEHLKHTTWAAHYADLMIAEDEEHAGKVRNTESHKKRVEGKS